MSNSPYVTRQVLAIKLVDKFYYKLGKKALFWYSSYLYDTNVLNRTSYEFSTGLKQVVAIRDDVYMFAEIRLTLVRHDRWLVVRLKEHFILLKEQRLQLKHAYGTLLNGGVLSRVDTC